MYDMKCGNKGKKNFGILRPVVTDVRKAKGGQAYFIDAEGGEEVAGTREEVRRELEGVRGGLRGGDSEGGGGGGMVIAPMKLVKYGMVEYC